MRYGFRPVLLETFVEFERCCGTCYKAANWIDVGRTGQVHSLQFITIWCRCWAPRSVK